MKNKITFESNNFNKIKNEILEDVKKEKKVLSFMNTHCIYEFNNNPDYQNAVMSSDVKRRSNSIDGILLSLVLSIKSFKPAKRLQGPTLMKKFLGDKDLNKNKKHFFLGYEKKELNKTSKKYPFLKRENIFGYLPPFVKGNCFSDKEVLKIIKIINKNKIDYLWNGMGCPKQQILTSQIHNKVNAKYIFNVGAALDFTIGRKKRAPRFFQKIGLEWLHRLFTDPKLTINRIYPSIMGGIFAFNTVKLKQFYENK